MSKNKSGLLPPKIAVVRKEFDGVVMMELIGIDQSFEKLDLFEIQH